MKFFSHSFLYLAGEGISKGSLFILTPFIINNFTKTEYGQFSLFIAAIPFVSVLMDLGQRSAVKIYYINFENKILSFLSSIAFVPMTLFITLLTFTFIYRGSDVFLTFLLLNSFLFTFIELYVNYLQISRKAIKYNILFILRNSLPFYIFLLLILVGTTNIYEYFITQAVILLILAVYVINELKHNLNMSNVKAHLIYSLKFSLPLLPAILSGIILSLSDRYVIEYFCSTDKVGLYSFAYNISSIFFVAVAAMNKSWQTFFLNSLKEKAFGAIRIMAKKYILLAFVIGVSVISFRNVLIHLLGNKDYLMISNLIPIIVAGMFFYFLYTIYSNVAFYYKDTMLFALPAIIAAVLNLALNIILIPLFDYTIAAVTTLIAYGFEFLVIFVIVKYKYNIRIL